MSTKSLVPLCFAAALLVACGHRDDGQSGTYSKGPNGTGTAADPATDPAATAPGAGDTATTPGGNAGDPSTTPPNTTSSPEAPPVETTPPPPSGG